MKNAKRNKEVGQMLLNHIAKLIEFNRDYINKPNKTLSTQYKWFMDRIDDIYELGWIDIETYNKAMMGIEYLTKTNREEKSGKKKN